MNLNKKTLEKMQTRVLTKHDISSVAICDN